MANDSMKPINAGAPQMIPQGNLNDSPGSYSSMMKALNAARSKCVNSRTSAYPNFKPGYDTPGLEGEWQTTTIK